MARRCHTFSFGENAQDVEPLLDLDEESSFVTIHPAHEMFRHRHLDDITIACYRLGIEYIIDDSLTCRALGGEEKDFMFILGRQEQHTIEDTRMLLTPGEQILKNDEKNGIA